MVGDEMRELFDVQVVGDELDDRVVEVIWCGGEGDGVTVELGA